MACRLAPYRLPRCRITGGSGLVLFALTRCAIANLFFVAHALSATPEVLDQENEDLCQSVHRLYFGLLIAAPYLGHTEATRMTGVNQAGMVNVRQVSYYDAVPGPPGCRGAGLDDAMLRGAYAAAEGIAALEAGGGHERTWRVIHAFHEGLLSLAFGDRIHQFVRCVEGFVLPETGATRRQFINRSQLFLGPGHEQLLGELFDIRSKVEHLHGPYAAFAAPDRRAADLMLAEWNFKAESIARACLQRLFTTRALWPHFVDDAALSRFWTLTPAVRSGFWGQPSNINATFGHFNTRTATIQMT